MTHRNSGNVENFNLRRSITGLGNTAQPDYVFSIGSNTLSDTLSFRNKGNIEIHNDLKLG